MEELILKYVDIFGELPVLPKMMGYEAIKDLMEDAIVSKKPVSQDQIVNRLYEIDEPVDLSSF